MLTEQLLCWSGMTDTKHTSGSNEEDLSLSFPTRDLTEKISFNKK